MDMSVINHMELGKDITKALNPSVCLFPTEEILNWKVWEMRNNNICTNREGIYILSLGKELIYVDPLCLLTVGEFLNYELWKTKNNETCADKEGIFF